ncbi:MAG: hypothetical protein KA327_09840 [Pseudarcicella sp.]|nr:hypothetical protein [Pseudarcicella sp.]
MSEISPKEPQKETKEDSSWIFIFLGVALMGGSFFFYYLFDDIEKGGESIKINWMFYLAYKIGGKWTVSIILFVLGVYRTYQGVTMLNKKKN